MRSTLIEASPHQILQTQSVQLRWFVDGTETENSSSSSAASGTPNEGDSMPALTKLRHEMSVLSRQVAAVTQELQEVTRLLRPLLHHPSTFLTPPPSLSSHSCSPAPPFPTHHAPVGCPAQQTPPLGT
ncbi:hypothetical protein OJAV_G00016890 [Oryzias javanicus]|uniref:Uncharacterized protein n=1 Tax=Oryzias javanicus TaxID=123683 RepID=A0A437DKQ6_ORYJA|nr:hypothetical protein OJAV_G00016890 [Oryzias javanicus]